MSDIRVEDLLLHPVRMRMLLTLAGNELTPAEIAERLPDVPHATLYRHIARLRDVGVLKVVAEEKKRGGRERTYALAVTQHINLEESFVDAGPEAQMRFFLTFVTSLLQDFALYLEHAKGKERNDIGFHSSVVNLTDAEFRELAARLAEAFRPYLGNEPGKGRRARTVSTIVIPRPDPADT